MPREPKRKKGQGNITRELLGSDRITVFEDARTRAGYSTQRPRVISAASRPKSPSKSPTKLSSSSLKPRSESPTPPNIPDEINFQGLRPKWKPQRTKGKVRIYQERVLVLKYGIRLPTITCGIGRLITELPICVGLSRGRLTRTPRCVIDVGFQMLCIAVTIAPDRLSGVSHAVLLFIRHVPSIARKNGTEDFSRRWIWTELD